jgi:hypothetical protein
VSARLFAVVLLACCACAERSTPHGDTPPAPVDARDGPGGSAAAANPDVALDDAATDGDAPADPTAIADETGEPGDAAEEETGEDTAEVAEDAGLPPLRDDLAGPDWRWDQKVRRLIDRTTLAAAFRAAGRPLPEDAAVFAARIVPGVGGPAYVLYEAGAGAFSQVFWPASTVKVVAALAALDFVGSLGFTGAAQVAFDSGAADAGTADTLRAIIDRAVLVSSNDDYDLTVLVAGLDRLNEKFLTAANGFPTTILERSYTGRGIRDSPGLTLTEGGRIVRVEARRGREDYGCPDHGNCADLFELTEAVRRVMLAAEIPAAERFPLDPADLAALQDALCGGESSFYEGAKQAFGAEPRICHKTGSVHDRDFLDHGLLEDPASGARYLLAASLPDQGGATETRAALSDLAELALRTLARARGGHVLQPAAGVPLAVQLEPLPRARGGRSRVVLTVDAPGADEVEAWVDGRAAGSMRGDGPRFTLETPALPNGDRLLVVTASRAGSAIGYRSHRVRIGPPAAAGR